MQREQFQNLVLASLEELKAIDIVVLDVTHLTSITDFMIICTGRSSKHVQSIAENLIENMKKNSIQLIGVEGHQTGEWVLVDLSSIIVHIMQVQTREFYQLEKLWSVTEYAHE